MNMAIKEAIPLWLRRLSSVFAAHGYPVYIVGGFIRNLLLGLPGSDMDITGPLKPDALMNEFRNLDNIKIIPKALEFGTVEIHMREQDKLHICEYTTFRRDRYREGGSHIPDEVYFTDSMEEDALRRDFTMNALYYELEKDKLWDPVGGMKDIREGILRTVMEDPWFTFKDDGLRLLRMVRFACQLKFSVDELSYRTARENIALLKDLSRERIRDEFIKILLSDTRYPSLVDKESKEAHRRGLMMLEDLNAFQYIIPEILEGIDEDAFWHALKACIASPPVLHLRLAALLHDVAKPSFMRVTGKTEGYERLSADWVRRILGQNGLKFDKRTIQRVAILVENHGFDRNNELEASLVRKKFADLGFDRVRDLIQLRLAIRKVSDQGSNGDESIEKWEQILSGMEGTPISPDHLEIGGKEIMDILGEGPSHKIGKVKRLLFDRVLEQPEGNQRDILKRWVAEFKERQEGK